MWSGESSEITSANFSRKCFNLVSPGLQAPRKSSHPKFTPKIVGIPLPFIILNLFLYRVLPVGAQRGAQLYFIFPVLRTLFHASKEPFLSYLTTCTPVKGAPRSTPFFSRRFSAYPTVPEGHKHRVTTPENPWKILRTPAEPRRRVVPLGW